MTDNHAELKLYFGLCSSHGCSEGRFDSTRTDNWSSKRHYTARDTVERYLVRDREFLEYGDERFSRNEEGALFLIDFVKNIFSKSKGGFELIDCIHGHLRFYRKIIFPDWEEDKREELTDSLQASGFIPNVMFGNPMVNLSAGHPAVKNAWKGALKFYKTPPKNFCEF